jgi:RNA polymerase sigma factor (sigma-70 family)
MRGLTPSSNDANVIGASLSQPQAFARVFDRHVRSIWRYACRRAGPAAADEIVSETFLRAFAGRADYDATRSDAAPWLYGIATNVLREHARREARRRRDAAAGPPDGGLDEGDLDRAEARVDAMARVPATAAALARLEPEDRETLLLFALTDLGYERIATAMDVPVGTVRSRLHRARRVMRAELGLAEDERSRR